MMTSTRHALPLVLTAALLVAACHGGGGSPSAGASPTPSPTGTSSNPEAFVCPSTGAPNEVARSGGDDRGVRRMGVAKAPGSSLASNLYAVTYDRNYARSAASSVATRERLAGAAFVRQFDFAHIGRLMRIVSFEPGQASAGLAMLRSQPGVRAVAPTGSRRYRLTVSQPYFTNDPYFDGFTNPNPPSAGATTPPETYHVPPYEENDSVPGQWDLHAIGLEDAFAYSQSGNGSSVATNPGALGSGSVKIAVIDTGEDSTHPELSSKIVYQKCFISDQNGANQTTSSYSTDPQGHGTNVAGIAAGDINNSLGFASAGGNVVIDAYRVFPTPDDNCASDSSNDPQCGASSDDIVSAVEDAIAQHANVINLSLGGSTCTNGQDSDAAEGAAIADAIAANIIVVAAAGNDGSQGVNAPGCDPGVIAVGATSLADGEPNGAGNSNGSSASPSEYVASYSDYGSPGAQVGSSSAWGIVAPGGDPNGGGDTDDLHWIEHIWTSTPFMANAGDTSFTGTCTGDYPGDTGTVDCRVLIAGTSQATPHVAGAAALIISANSAYQNPANMKALLCSTANDISDSKEGCGRLNLYRAMAKALGDSPLP